MEAIMNDQDKYLYKSKLQELSKELRDQGYTISHEVHIDDVIFDLIANKDNESIAYEIKVRSTLADSKEQLNVLRNIAKKHNIDFRIVIVTPPRQIEVDVEDLEFKISEYISTEVPDELAALSGNTYIDGVCDLEYDIIQIENDRIFLQGSGAIDVELEYGGGEGKDGMGMYDSYPFDFNLELSHNMEITELKIKVDTSSFYE